MEPTPRDAALDLLAQVLHHRRPFDEVLEKMPGLDALESRDRALARNLAATTLRRLGQIDDLLGRCLERPLPRKAWPVRDILRLGACQLLFLETPAHAAVDTAVRLAQRRGHGPHKKLVNAVLRRLQREGAPWRDAQDAARLNTPDWLWRSWSKAYGPDTCRAIAQAHLVPAPLDLTVKSDPDTWAGRLDARKLATGCLRRAAGGAVSELPGFRGGNWWVQDAAAALPARLLGDVAGLRVVDLCAAPGGKTAQLAAAGARVIAVERSATRADRLRENLKRLDLEAEVVVADAAEWRPEEPADAVLLDAPCSATGTIRRHPDVTWLKKPDDVKRMADLQRRLLAGAVEMVRPGGTVVYCSCSLQPEEGPAVLDQELPAERFAVLPGEAGLSADWLTEAGELRTLPCHMADDGGMDGFFAVRLRRQ